ncbi:cupin domain-containing protein [Kitasatospora sp. NA04385]|uniref:cupin domain-containing protein n=1 Tax=Kitasatospora sp. NA04385 TaxID=2742135 RepID=UPI00158FA54D|nr:cupin domain-containing protein [Kitasatospora sp. NA04385]QKW23638.1 cupin domain-containing protein [Kitasatospora sp. NA04385]
MSGIQIQRRADAPTREEYGCEFRRILPWQRSGPSDTGMGVCTVAPGTATTPHSHVDHEQFYVVRGSGTVEVEGERAEVGPGDAIVVGSHQVHHFENGSATEELELLSVWSLGPLGGE